MKKQAKAKLPKVWVEFRRGTLTGAYYNRPWHGFDGVTRFIQYAPVQPPRRCVWKLQPHSVTNGHTACGWWMDRDSTLKFCARCGGKIVRKS